MYTGTYPATMDENGRIKIPRKFQVLMELHDEYRFIIILGFHKNLCLYPRREWTKFQRQLESSTRLDPDTQDFFRILYGSMTDVTVTDQGRITIPAALRDMIHAEHDVMLIGVMDHLELWSRAEWDAYCAASQGKYREMVAKILGGESDETMK